MKKYILLFVSISAFLISCGNTKHVADNPTDGPIDTGSQSTENQSFFKDIAQGDSLFASIKKGYCYGKCPVYEIRIYNSGLVVLQGTANIDLLGEHKAQLTKEQLQTFIDHANSIAYFDMQDEYDNKYISDLPSATTSIVIDGKRKQVRRRYQFPNSILTFEALFADLLETEKWSPGLAER